MMRRMSEPGRLGTRRRAPHVEEGNLLLEPGLRLMAEDFKAIAGGESVVLDKRLDTLDHRQRRPGHADVEYVGHPLNIALTLVNQMVERAAGTRLHALSKALLGNCLQTPSVFSRSVR